MLKRKAHEGVEKATYLWFLQSVACRAIPILGPILTENALQFHCRLHGEESADDIKPSQGWILDQVDGAEAYSIKSMEQRPAASSFQVKSLKVIRVMSCYQPNLNMLASLQSKKQTSRNGRTSTAISHATLH